VNFITYLEPPYLLDYNYIVVPLPIGFFVNAYLNGEVVQKFLTVNFFKKHYNKRCPYMPSDFIGFLMNSLVVMNEE
jgi:hypothetical protein